MAQVDCLAGFGWDEVERTVGDLDEAVETDASGGHDVRCLILVSGFAVREV